jgi:hypothetical protein
VSTSASETHLVSEPEDPRILEANLNVGIRLFASAVAFVFLGFVFAFFYLRALNSNGDWRIHINPSQGYGVATLACVLGAIAFFEFARRGGLARAATGVWRPNLAISLVLAIASAVLLVLQLTSTPFPVTNGGYASVFYGVTALLLVFWLGAVYWLETLLAGTLRGVSSTEEVSGGPLELLGPSAVACEVYLAVMAGIEIIFYVLLYLIK